MPAASQYWMRVRQIQEGFGGKKTIWLVSLENVDKGTKAGVVIAASAELAARCVLGGTHRAATEDEVIAYQSGQEKEKVRLEAVEEKKKPTQRTLVLSGEQINQLAGSVGTQAPPAPRRAAPAVSPAA